MWNDLKRVVLGTAPSLLLVAVGACAPDAVAPSKPSTGTASVRAAEKRAAASVAQPAKSRKASAGMTTAQASAPPMESAFAPAAPPAASPAAPSAPAGAQTPMPGSDATAVAALKRWPAAVASTSGAAAGAAGAAVGGSPAPAAGAGGMDGCIPIETRRRGRLPTDTGIKVCGLPGESSGAGSDLPDGLDDLFGGAGGAGAAGHVGGAAGVAGQPGMPSAGSGAASSPATSIDGTAVFTHAASGVNLGVVLEACTPQKFYPVRIQEGTDCQGSISAGSRWDPPRGDGIPDVMCGADGTAHASYLRSSADAKPWAIGVSLDADVVGKAVVLYDPDDPLQAIACGVISKL